MKKIKKNKTIQYFKLLLIILVIISVAFSQIFDTRNVNNKLSSKDVALLVIYIFGITVIPLIAYFVNKSRKQKN